MLENRERVAAGRGQFFSPQACRVVTANTAAQELNFTFTDDVTL